MIVLEGGFLLPSSRVLEVCPGGRGMVLDEIDTCISAMSGAMRQNYTQTFENRFHLRLTEIDSEIVGYG